MTVTGGSPTTPSSGGSGSTTPLPENEQKREDDYIGKNGEGGNPQNVKGTHDVYGTVEVKESENKLQKQKSTTLHRKPPVKIYVKVPKAFKDKEQYKKDLAQKEANRLQRPVEVYEDKGQPEAGGSGANLAALNTQQFSDFLQNNLTGFNNTTNPNANPVTSPILNNPTYYLGGTNPPPQNPPTDPPSDNPPGGPLQGVGTPRVTGTLTINGNAYRFGSGSSPAFPHIPFGTYPITPNSIGPWGRANGAIGINNNSIWDPNLGRTRAGIEFHASRSGFTQGCMGIDAAQYGNLKQDILKMIQENGSAYLTIGPNGAYITPTPGGNPGGATSTPSTNLKATSVTGAGPGYTEVKMEDGTVQRREGDRNWRNNNPGNIQYGDFARANGAIGTDGRFAVFPTLDAGKNAMQKLLFNSSGYRGLTIGQAISKYAPPSENNTQKYTETVTRALGLPANTPMSSLSPEQQRTMTETMTRVEGFRPGTINGIPATSGNALPPLGGTGGVTGGGTGGSVSSQPGRGLYPSTTQGLNVSSGAIGNTAPQAVMLSLAQFLQQNIAGYQSAISFTVPPANSANNVPYQQGLALDFTLVNPTLANSIIVEKFINGWFEDFNIKVIVTNFYRSVNISRGYIHVEIPQGDAAYTTLYVLDLITAFNAQLTGITIIPL